MEQVFQEILVCLSLWVWVPSLWSQAHGKLSKNELEASPFQQCVSLSTQYAGNDIFPQGRKGINRECVFRPLSLRNCLVEGIRPPGCQKGLTSRVRAGCLPALSEPRNPIPRPHGDCPWKSWLWECVWKCWVPFCGHQVKVTFHCKGAQSKGLWPAHILKKSQRVHQCWHCHK